MEKVRVGSISQFYRGVSYNKSQADKQPKSGMIGIIRANNLESGKFIFDDLVYVPSEVVASNQYINTGDIIISMSSGSKTHVGKVSLATSNIPYSFGAFCGKIVPTAVLPKFLYYNLCSGKFREYIEQKSKGTNINNIKKSYILDYEINFPPLQEQERIVARIEELFSQLDNGVETLKRTKQQLAVYRQAVLKEAFSICRENTTMDQVASMIDPQPSHRTPPKYKDGIPYIGIGDVDYKKKALKFDEARKVNPAILEEHIQRYTLHQGDFIMGKIGTIGKPFILPLPQNYTLSANVILIQPFSEKINPEYLFWQFASSLIAEQLMKGKNETSQPAFGIQKARLLQIKLCSFEIQEKVVNSIREKMSVCDSIEQTIDTALRQAEALRQIILKKAFEGELA